MTKAQKDHAILVWAKLFLLAISEKREVWSIKSHRPYRVSQ